MAGLGFLETCDVSVEYFRSVFLSLMTVDILD